MPSIYLRCKRSGFRIVIANEIGGVYSPPARLARDVSAFFDVSTGDGRHEDYTLEFDRKREVCLRCWDKIDAINICYCRLCWFGPYCVKCGQWHWQKTHSKE